MSLIHYKFKSAKNYDSISFEGLTFSLFDLKREILIAQKLRGTDSDIIISNAQTNEDYLDDSMLIPKNTSVYVRRVPAKPGGPNAMYYLSDDPQNALQAKTGEVHADLSSFGGGVSTSNFLEDDEQKNIIQETPFSLDGVIPGENEEEKLQALFDQTSNQWRQQTSQIPGHQAFYKNSSSNYNNQRHINHYNKPISANYVCHKCGIKGHYVQNCPNPGERRPMQPRVKKTTGIPRSFLKNVEQVPDGKGAMVASDGSLVIAQANSAAWEKIRKNHIGSGFSAEELRETAPQIPELLCNICNKLLRNAVSAPCCKNLFCLECITDSLINPDPEKHFKCPVCLARDVVPDSLVTEQSIRTKVDDHLKAWASKRVDIGSASETQAEKEDSSPNIDSQNREKDPNATQLELDFKGFFDKEGNNTNEQIRNTKLDGASKTRENIKRDNLNSKKTIENNHQKNKLNNSNNKQSIKSTRPNDDKNNKSNYQRNDTKKEQRQGRSRENEIRRNRDRRSRSRTPQRTINSRRGSVSPRRQRSDHNDTKNSHNNSRNRLRSPERRRRGYRSPSPKSPERGRSNRNTSSPRRRERSRSRDRRSSRSDTRNRGRDRSRTRSPLRSPRRTNRDSYKEQRSPERSRHERHQQKDSDRNRSHGSKKDQDEKNRLNNGAHNVSSEQSKRNDTSSTKQSNNKNSDAKESKSSSSSGQQPISFKSSSNKNGTKPLGENTNRSDNKKSSRSIFDRISYDSRDTLNKSPKSSEHGKNNNENVSFKKDINSRLGPRVHDDKEPERKRDINSRLGPTNDISKSNNKRSNNEEDSSFSNKRSIRRD